MERSTCSCRGRGRRIRASSSRHASLQQILTQLCVDYEIVIIDTPPALRVGDAMTLSAFVDGILVVTRLNMIRRPMLTEFARLLETAPARKLGYVVTASREGGSTAYGYGYGYGGYGYAEPENIETQRATVDEADRV